MSDSEATVQVVEFEQVHADAFRQLNLEWMRQHWPQDALHDRILDHPHSVVVQQGGSIAIALLDGVPIGTCALLNCGNQEYELAKMCVTPAAQGKGAGRLLASHIIGRARESGCRRLFLKTARVLQPAITLYEKLGFRRLDCYSSADQRCDLEMEMLL